MSSSDVNTADAIELTNPHIPGAFIKLVEFKAVSLVIAIFAVSILGIVAVTLTIELPLDICISILSFEISTKLA